MLSRWLGALAQGSPLPDDVRVGKSKRAVALSAEDWDGMRAEMGIDERSEVTLCELVRGIARCEGPAQRDEAQGTAPGQLPTLALGLVVLTSALEVMGRHGRPSGFALGPTTLADAMTEHGLDTSLEAEEARQAVAAVLAWAGGKADNEGTLRAAYFAYWRRLLRTLRGGSDTPAPRQRPEQPALSENFLVRGLRKAAEERSSQTDATEGRAPTSGDPPPASPSPSPRVAEGAAGDDLTKLVARMLEPLLWLPEDPLRSLERAADRSEGILRDLALGCRTLIASPQLEIFGEPGQRVEVSLPCAEYAPMTHVAGRMRASGAFVVERRGVKIAGTVVLPALLRPSRRGRGGGR